MTYTSVVKLNDDIKDKNIFQKNKFLCDVQKDVYPEIEKSFIKSTSYFWLSKYKV